MNLLLPSLPYLISLLTGYLVICLIFLNEEETIESSLHLFLAGGLGLAISAHLTFYSIVAIGQLSKTTTLIAHILIIAILIGFLLKLGRRKRTIVVKSNSGIKSTICIFSILLGLIPLYLIANVYPLGGWDAWACWNLKAKFLYLGGKDWKNVFDPLLWGSSPHYPLLLPLINVWGWSFFNLPDFQIPFITSVIFSFLTASLLYSALRPVTKNFVALAAPFLMLSSLFFIKLAGSQYADIVLGYYLLASIICLVKSQLSRSKSWVLLSGIFLGILSFSKPEGFAATFLLVLLGGPYLFIKNNLTKVRKRKSFLAFLAVFFIFALPTALFYLLYAPANQTFINGLVLPSHPSNLLRLQMIVIFLAIELVSNKWNGIWLLLAAGLLISKGRCLKRPLTFVPLFLIFYTLLVITYYFTNTYFEIGWWLQVTLNRVLFALLPMVIYWVFYSMGQEEQSQKSEVRGQK